MPDADRTRVRWSVRVVWAADAQLAATWGAEYFVADAQFAATWGAEYLAQFYADELAAAARAAAQAPAVAASQLQVDRNLRGYHRRPSLLDEIRTK